MMNGRWRLNPSYLKAITYAAIAIFSAYILVFSLGTSSILKDNSHASITYYIDRTCQKPFIFRALYPLIGQAVTAIIPTSSQENVSKTLLSFLSTDNFQDIIRFARWGNFSTHLGTTHYVFSTMIIALCIYGALVTYGITLYKLSAAFFEEYVFIPAATALFGLVLLLPFVQWRAQIYDAPTLAFSALCLLFLVKRKWGAYLVCFSLGCLNKETIILQTVIFTALYATTMERKRFLRLLALQCFIFLTIIGTLHYVYADNPVDMHAPLRMFSTMDNFDKSDMMTLIVSYALLFGRWREIPPALKRSLWLLAFDIAIYYIYGMYREYRVLADALPSITLIAGYTLFKMIEPEPRGKIIPAHQ